MYVTEEKFNALLELVNAMKTRLDVYEKCENAREQEFRELERDVHNLKHITGSSLSAAQDCYETIQTDYTGTVGTAWLR